MEIAVDFERDVLRGLDHVLDRDRLRLTRQVVAPLGAAHRVDQARAPQAQQDLLDIVVRQLLVLRQFARRHGSLPRPLGEVQGDDQTVFGPGGDAHRSNMRPGLPGFNGPGLPPLETGGTGRGAG